MNKEDEILFNSDLTEQDEQIEILKHEKLIKKKENSILKSP